MTTQQVLPKTELIAQLAREAELPQEAVVRLLDALGAVTVETLGGGLDLRLPGIGTLRRRQVRGRTGTTPTGRVFVAAPQVRVGLRPAERLLTQINQAAVR